MLGCAERNCRVVFPYEIRKLQTFSQPKEVLNSSYHSRSEPPALQNPRKSVALLSLLCSYVCAYICLYLGNFDYWYIIIVFLAITRTYVGHHTNMNDSYSLERGTKNYKKTHQYVFSHCLWLKKYYLY